MSIDEIYLQKALGLAKYRRGFCAPNPSVGAVIVKDHEILATGFHFAVGHPHAEVDALFKCHYRANQATVYVTLEPCCHVGRTPPCTDALVKAGVARVVYGYRDPNPVVSGKGELALIKAGIQCDYVPTPEIHKFYQSYQHWQSTQTPFVTAKIALSLDGKIAGAKGQRVMITGDAVAELTHLHRKHTDAILTTAKTLQHDDPSLNARYQNEIIAKKIYVLDRLLATPLTAKIFATADCITFFHQADVSQESRQALISLGARCVAVKTTHEKLDLHEVIKLMGEDGVHDLWVEAGGTCFTECLQQKIINKAYIYVAPKIIGNGISAFTQAFEFPTQTIVWQQMGPDVVAEIYF